MKERDPHYLHQRGGLQAVVSPPVDGVQALAWHPRREELLVGTREGQLLSVDPVMGTRVLAQDLPEAGAMAISPEGDRVAVLGRASRLELRDLSTGDLVFQVPLALVSDLWVGFWKGGVAVAGQGLERRELRVLDLEGRSKARGELPQGAVVGVDGEGSLLLGRCSSAGPEVHRLGEGRLTRAEPTGHRLRFGDAGLLYGVAEGGITVWAPGAAPITVRAFGVTAAGLSADARLLAFGTREGEVALSELSGAAVGRAHAGRTGGHDQMVRVVAFSRRGRWLATVGDRTWLWSY